MKEKIIKILFPSFTLWEKVLITKYGIRYSILLKRRNNDNGMWQFKTIFVAEIDEEISNSDLFNLI
jgi:hypothetical protein